MTNPEEALVCMPVGNSPFDDNKRGECFKCGRAVEFRPWHPDALPKLCLPCFWEQDLDKIEVRFPARDLAEALTTSKKENDK